MDQDPKSLQKLTESRNPTNLDELLEQLNQHYPEPPKDAGSAQHRARTQKIVEAILASPFQTEEQRTYLRNQTWQSNHRELTQVIASQIVDKHKLPSVNILAQKTGLSRQTISKHLRAFHLSESYHEQLQQFRAITAQVVAQLFRLAMQGNVRAAQLYLEAVGGLPGIEPVQYQSTPTANYIQINNNIKIDQLTFTLLPQEVQQQITELILQGLQTALAKAGPDPG